MATPSLTQNVTGLEQDSAHFSKLFRLAIKAPIQSLPGPHLYIKLHLDYMQAASARWEYRLSEIRPVL
jgi:hypothetical protein